MPALNPITIRAARAHLRKTDPVMRRMINDVGQFKLRRESNRFGMLVRSIISQQISVSAARSIRIRLEDAVRPDDVSPTSILRLKSTQLRAIGLSGQKASYICDLAEKVANQQVNLRHIGRYSDETIIDELTLVKGIGRWTAQMFLIFALGRPDVLPCDDLGLRTAIRDRYELDDLPDKKTSQQIAQPWSPFATVATWYCWRSIDLKKGKKIAKAGYPS